jgi:multidrug resistance efflux pump
VFYRFAALAALSAVSLFAQESTPVPAPASAEAKAADPNELTPDDNDPGVIRARKDLQRVQLLISQGALPAIRLRKAQEDVKNAEDLSILQAHLFGKDITAEQADQMLFIAQRLVMRRERSMIETQQLVQSGVISRSEAEASGADFDRAQTELHLAQTRVNLILQMSEALKLQKSIASLENEAETHPEWNGKVYTKYDGNGVFTPADLQKVSIAFAAKFAKPLPISADGETATHRALGFDHRGRVDVAVSPDMPEGAWLMKYLETNRIPYFAFRMAVPGKATGAHIHMGPQSTRLKVASSD